jgi:molybdate transport system substrate-binding protein
MILLMARKNLQNLQLAAGLIRLRDGLGISSILVCMLSALLSSFAPPATSQSSDPLLISAASDLAPLESPLLEALSREIGTPVRFVFGSSGQLAAQLRAGAPYDLYLSASIRYAQDLESSGHLKSGSVAPYATGRLGLWSRGGKIRSIEDLSGPAVVHVAIPNPVHAPYGIAATQLLQSFGVWDRLQPKLVLGENTRQALQFAERGNADAVLTAWTLIYDRPEAVRMPDRYPLLVQGGGIAARTSRGYQAAKAFAFLRSPAGRAILTRFGLFPPPEK